MKPYLDLSVWRTSNADVDIGNALTDDAVNGYFELICHYKYEMWIAGCI